MKVSCKDKDRIFRTSEAATKSWFRVNGLIDKYLNILDLNGFRKNNTKWSNYAKSKYGVEGRLFSEDNNGTKAIPNTEMFKRLDETKGIFYQVDTPIKEGVDFVFEQSPELSDIGTKQQYSQYLDTVFPESKVEDIVYHGGPTGITIFSNESQIGKRGTFHFSAFTEDAVRYAKTAVKSRTGKEGVVYAVKLNINNYREVEKGFVDATKKDDFKDNDALIGIGYTTAAEVVVKNPEQIHILGSKQDIEGFKEFVSKDSYQIESSKETSDSKIDSTIKSWLEKVGIKYTAVDKIYDNEGNEVSAVAKADIVGKLIEVVEGKRGIDTLPEEAGHMLVRMLGSEHPLVQVMIKNVSNYKVYQDVIENDNYVRAYNNDETKLREEAVGKMIAQVLVAKMTGKELNPEQRKEESRILAAWKWLVNRLGRLIGTNAKDELFTFKQAADIIIEHTPIEESEDFRNPLSPKTIFYQLDEAQTQKVVEKLQETNAYYDVTQKAYFTKEGRRIKKRVSDIVKTMESRWFKNKKETEMSPESKKHAAAGTITHAYFKEVTLTILEQVGDDYSKAKYAKIDFPTIQNRVLAELRNDPELKAYGDDFLRSFNATHFTEVVNDVTRRLERVQMTQDRINKETGKTGKARVFPEFTIFSPEKDLAGTIDLLVVYSNGKTSVYDYKGQYFRTKLGKVVEDFKGTKIRSGRAQTNEYKKILKEEYGIEEFVEVRLVPFNFQYNRAGNISKIEVGNTASDRTYLSEVPTELETTGIKVLDEQLEKMFKIREELEGKLLADPYNDKLKLQLDRLNTSITKITVDKDTRYVYKEVNSIIEDFQQRLTRPDRLGVTFEYLNDTKYYLTMYSEFFRKAKVFELSIAEDDAKKKLIEDSYNSIHVKIQDILMDIDEKIQDLITAENPDLDFEKPVQEISQLGALFTRLSQFSRAQFKALHRLVISKEQYVRTKVQEVYDELSKRREELNTWAKSRGMSLQEATDLMIDLKKGQLKSKYSGVYAKEKQQAIKDRDYKWFEENTQIKRTLTGYEYTNPEQAKKFEELKKSKLEQLANQHPVGSEMYIKKKEEWESKYDITVNRDAIFEKPYYITLVEQDRFLSEFWQMAKRPENKPLMDAYNSLVKINQVAGEITGRKIDNGFIPEIQQGIIESLSNWNAGIGAIKDNIKRSFTVEEESMLMGRRDVNTGEQIPTIPLLYTHELTVSLTERELDEVKNELKSKGILEGTEEYTDRLSNAIKTKEREKGILFKSRDLFTSALLFSETAYNHEYAKSIEEEVKALKYSLENVETELSAPNGKKILDKLTGKIATVVGAPKDEMEAFEKYIQLYIYGRQKQNKDFVVGEVSANKTITQAMRYTSIKALGLSWIVGFGNATGLAGNLLMAASEGKYYNKSQVAKAMSMMRGGKDKERINAILKYISPYAHNITYEKSRKLSTKTAKKVLNEDLFYVFMKYPDMAVDIVNALAILQNYGIDEQGRIRKVDGKIKPIIETLDTSGDKVTGLTETQYAAIRKLITTSSVKLKGNIFKEDANLIGTNVYLSMFMQFRNWMPGLIEQRFGKLKYNEDIGELEVGRFKVAYGEFTAKGVMPKLAAFIDLGAEVLSFGAYRNFSSKANKAVAEKYFQTFLEQNPELKGKVTMEQFMELREQKLRGMAMELRILLSLLGILQLIRAAIPDDDEDEVQEWIAKNAYRVTNRGLMEIMFFFDPSTVKQIAGRPLPLLNASVELFNFLGNTVDETRDLPFEKDYKGVLIWKEDKNDKTKPLYYTSKMVPVRGLTDFIDFFETHDSQIK